MVGMSPVNTTELVNVTGQALRQFVTIREEIAEFQGWLLATDLKVVPYSLSSADETTLKSAFAGLNTSLQAVDMTFINRWTGLFQP